MYFAVYFVVYFVVVCVFEMRSMFPQLTLWGVAGWLRLTGLAGTRGFVLDCTYYFLPQQHPNLCERPAARLSLK